MNKKRLLILVSALLCLCLLVPVLGYADFGDFSGDSDFGGSDWSSGSDWDSDSSWDSDDDYSSSSGGPYIVPVPFGGGGGGGGGGFPTLLILIIVAIIVISILRKAKGNSASSGPRPAGAQRTDQTLLRPIESYSELDPNFDAAALQEKLSNLYVQMQNGWTAKDIDPLRPYFTDALFAQMERQLDQMRQAERTNYVERIAVLGVTLRGFMQRNEEDHIIAELRTRIVDYTLDDKTGAVLSGDRNREKFMTYEWDLSRASGLTTTPEGAMTNISCPNCGAPLSINATARCPYCDSVVTLEKHDWAISAIKGISQQTM